MAKCIKCNKVCFIIPACPDHIDELTKELEADNMDANKLTVLKDINYKINRACGLCKHGTFPNNNWGTCKVHKYKHLKHTGEERELSINKFGYCNSFEEYFPECELGSFAEFLNDKI